LRSKAASWARYLVTQSWLPPDRPLFSATVRALPIGLLLLAARRELPRGDWWWKAAVLGACNISLFFALLFLGAYRLPGGLAATITAISPLLVMVLAWAALGVRAPFARVAGGVVGIVGVGLLVLRNPGSVDLLGLAGALGAVCSPQRWGSSSSRGGHRRPAPRGIGVPDRSGQPRRGHPLLVCGSCRRLFDVAQAVGMVLVLGGVLAGQPMLARRLAGLRRRARRGEPHHPLERRHRAGRVPPPAAFPAVVQFPVPVEPVETRRACACGSLDE